jgi:uncharacterized protein
VPGYPCARRASACSTPFSGLPAGGGVMQMTKETEEMRALVLQIAKALVDIPGEVNLEIAEKDSGSVLRLRVAPEDTGKVIGKQGRTARSIRTILAACSMKYHHHYSLEIIEEQGQSSPKAAVLAQSS